MRIENPTDAENDGDLDITNPFSMAKAGALGALAVICAPHFDTMTSSELGQYGIWQNIIENTPDKEFKTEEPNKPSEKSTEDIALENVRKMLCPDAGCPLTLASIQMATMEDNYRVEIKASPGPCEDMENMDDVKECAGAVLHNLLR